MELLTYYPWLYPVFAALFGLLIGSFLNVVIYRLPIMMEREWKRDCIDCFPEFQQGKTTEEQPTFNLSIPRSRCPKCNALITAKDNIPVLSWLWLKGRCRHCQHPISARYPLVELLTAAMVATVALLLPLSECQWP